MSITAVIPTTGRAELARAVRSVLNQSIDAAPLVVLDRPDRVDDVRRQLEQLPHDLILTSGGTGGAAARNLGVRAAKNEIVAFLDDDDEWMPDKSEKQIEMLQGQPDCVVTSRAILVGADTRVVPECTYSNSQSMASYLLDRSTFRLRKNFIQSSTLFLPRDLALKVPWKADLQRHQDWALLIDMRAQGVKVRTHPDPLVRVHQGTRGSISKSTDWRASVSWLADYGATSSRRARADFLCSVAMRSALAAHEYRAAAALFGRALTLRPHITAVAVGFSALARGRS